MQLAGSVQGTTTAPPRTAPMRCAGFRSILFDHSPGPLDDVSAPAYFTDLNLDQVERALVAGRDDYRLEPYFRTPLVDPELVQYRQEVFADLERRPVRAALDAFAAAMDEVRRCRARAATRRPFWEVARWHLEACLRYLDGVRSLGRDLRLVGCRSTGLVALASYLDEYVSGQTFGELGVEAAGVARELADIRYAVWIRGARVSVGPTDDEADWADDIRATFARFADPGGERRGVASRGADSASLDPVESRILERVALEFPAQFAHLQEFVQAHPTRVDPLLARFDREVQFYLAWLDLVGPLREAGLRVELPGVTVESKQEEVWGTFDIALALQLVPQGRPIVPNDLWIHDPERILVVTGPNNGGKTTLARAIGQLHHLAALGCPTQGHDAHLFLCDRIFTHFERREDPSALLGKLGEELERLDGDLEEATPRSLVIMNEMFSSTASRDAVDLSLAILGRVADLDALAVCVTFLDELSVFSPKAVSLVSEVDPHDPEIRTFTLRRRPADGRAHASALARRYGLTADQLRERLES